MKLGKKDQPAPVVAEVEKPMRQCSFSLRIGEKETLQTVQEAWHRARCLGVPDRARVRFSGGYMTSVYEVTFSWSEDMQ
jgi:hypothetical protein